MSQKETTVPTGRLDAGKSPGVNLSKYSELAREAYEQKRTKDCLDLTRAMLLIDPDNAEAQSMRLSIQSEMHRDLDNARAFLRQAQGQAQGNADPQQQSQTSTSADPSAGYPIQPILATQDASQERDLPFVAGHVQHVQHVRHVQPPGDTPSSNRAHWNRWLAGASAFAVVCVVVAGLMWLKTNSNPVEASMLPTVAADRPKPPATENADKNADKIDSQVTNSKPTVVTPPVVSKPSTASAIPPAAAPRLAAIPPDGGRVAATGILAISSRTSVDIFENGVFLGSAPVSLELSAGAHTLEYRHGGLQKSLTHVINGNETAKAIIAFEVTVQLNSKPWAEVFIDGVDRTALGQTPLSGVRVPIGTVLTFENPQFQPRKYRITGNETGIQVVFP